MDPKFILPTFIYAPKGSRKVTVTTTNNTPRRQKRDTYDDTAVLAPKPRRGAQGPKKPPMFGKRSPAFTPRQYWILTDLYDHSHTCGQMPKDHFLRLFHLVFAHKLLVIKSNNTQELIPASEILASFETADRRGFYFKSVDFNNPHHGSAQNINRIRDIFKDDGVVPLVGKTFEAQQRKTVFRNSHKVAPEENGSHGEVTGWDDVEMSGRYPICGKMDCFTCFHECFICEDEFESCMSCQRYSFLKNHKGGLCTASRDGLASRLPTCGVASCSGCNLRCGYCALFQCAVCVYLTIRQIGPCTAGEGWGMETEPSWETLANTAVPGWTVLPEQVVHNPFHTSSLNGSHGEFTESDDVDNVDNALAQMANAQVFDNQPGIGRDRREARNHQRRRPIQNRRADRPEQRPQVRLPPAVDEAINEALEQPDAIEPVAPEPPRVAVVTNMEIPSMGMSESPLYMWYIAMYYRSTIITAGIYLLGCVLDIGLLPMVVPACCALGYVGLLVLRTLGIDMGRITRYFNIQNVFTTRRFTRISPLRKTLCVTTGLDRTHLALSGYTGVYRGNVYEELVDPCVAKYGTGVMSDCKQGVMSHYMRELLKTTYPGTEVNQVTFANTVVFSTAAIIELQNTIKSHTHLSKAAYASSSMM